MDTINKNNAELLTHKDNTPLLFQFFTEIGIIEQLSRAKLESVLPDGLKISQFTVLNHLVRLEGNWNPARLASALQVTKAAMTNTLQRLESRGLVLIKPDPQDGRGKLVSLTSAGKDTREECIHRIEPLLIQMEKVFSHEKFLGALPFLQAVRSFLDDRR